MFRTFAQVMHENWVWRKQAWQLAKFDLVKTYRGAALGWIWLFIKPAVYVSVYYFTLVVGMRHSTDVNGMPFLLWLAIANFAWFFMGDCVNLGGDVYRRYSFLVNRIRFPLPVISTFFTLSRMIVFAGTVGFVIVGCAIFRIKLTIYLLQLPLIFILMMWFWTMWCMMLSPLSAISKDFSNLIKTLSTPLFWLSGILFDIQSLPRIGRIIMYFNPVSWACEAVRDAFIYFRWFWDSPKQLACYLFMCVLATIFAMLAHKRLAEEVPDVL